MSLPLLDVMRPEELEDTVVVFSVRDPVARAVSAYYYLRNRMNRRDVLAYSSIDDWIVSEREAVKMHRGPLGVSFAPHPLTRAVRESCSRVSKWLGYAAYASRAELPKGLRPCGRQAFTAVRRGAPATGK